MGCRTCNKHKNRPLKQDPRIGILSCVYGRHDLFRIFAEQLNRLKKYNIFPLVVGSEGRRTMEIAREYGLIYLECQNRPLGAKFNAGMRAMKTFNPDYVMVLGSDDLISEAYIRRFIEEMKKGYDLIGTTDCYFYSPSHKILGYWPGYKGARTGETIGLGRTLSSRLLHKCKWEPWIAKYNKGLDGSMMAMILKHGPTRKDISMARSGLFAVDVKYRNNITGFGCYYGKDLQVKPVALMQKNIPEAEKILKL